MVSNASSPPKKIAICSCFHSWLLPTLSKLRACRSWRELRCSARRKVSVAKCPAASRGPAPLASGKVTDKHAGWWWWWWWQKGKEREARSDTSAHSERNSNGAASINYPASASAEAVYASHTHTHSLMRGVFSTHVRKTERTVCTPEYTILDTKNTFTAGVHNLITFSFSVGFDIKHHPCFWSCYPRMISKPP